ncbi:MAG: lipase, partial [Cyanobacteria bacterium J149]
MYRFQVSAHTNMGESITLLGSTAELGSWNISNCIPLQTKSDRYPLWWADVDIPYTDSKIEYKYLKFSAEGEVIWESLGNDNRWIPLEKEAKETTLIVEDGWFGHLQPHPYGYWEKPLIQNPPLKGKNGLRILVIGSSVAMGCSAWLLKGWAELLKETLADKYGHQLINVSELGASVSTTIKRFESVVIPQKPDIVIIALSLGNEGFAYCQPHERKALQQRFESGLQRLIQMTKEIGAIPMLGSVYPHGEYSAEHNWFLYDTHSRMLSWDVPVLDWLTELNDGNGRFGEGLSFDVAHPNSEGHRVMFSAINVPIFDLDKEEAGKKKLSLKPIDTCLFDDQKGFKIAWREKNHSLLFTNNSKVDFQINPYRLELQD